LLQATIGCSHNKCTFCGSNLIKKFSIRPLEEIEDDIISARAYFGENIRRVFLLDANAMCMRIDDLLSILDLLYAVFPKLERVGTYVCAQDILRKRDEELDALYDKAMGIAYLGVESGDNEVLRRVKKGVNADEITEACKRIIRSGITLSVTVILGLGGMERWKEHAIRTAEVLNRIDPPYVGLLTLMVVPGTPLYREVIHKKFEVLNSEMILREMCLLVENLKLSNCIFRSNHASNYLPIGGILPEEKEGILECIDRAIEETAMLRPESVRGL
jgi:radical SAM superfamily enzyme YgiQ (UPF0313 family)